MPQLVSESGVEQEVVVPHNEPVMAALGDFCKKVMAPRSRNWGWKLEARMTIIPLLKESFNHKVKIDAPGSFSTQQMGTNMMKLVFDGETVLLGETPESLGMEDGDMVEVRSSASEPQKLIILYNVSFCGLFHMK